MTEQQMISDFVEKAIVAVRDGSIANRQATAEARHEFLTYVESLGTKEKREAASRRCDLYLMKRFAEESLPV